MYKGHLEVTIKAAVAAGNILTDYYNDKVQIASKESSRDIVSEVDKFSENAIIELLFNFDPSITIITEEQGKVIGDSMEKYWIIDGLDGTVNYINHIPFFSVSIAYVENGKTQVGAINAPM
ncbi:MAG TPA: inositol monophosphatase family protein, partial [Niabella sp.]